MAAQHRTRLIDVALLVMSCFALLCAVAAVLTWPNEQALQTCAASILPERHSALSESRRRDAPPIRMTASDRGDTFRSNGSSHTRIMDGDGFLQSVPIRSANGQSSGKFTLVDQRKLVDLMRRQTGSFALGLAALLIALACGILLAIRQSIGVLAERLSRIEQRCQEAGAQARDTAYFAPSLRQKNDDGCDQ